ncbi:MAG: glycosyltransferase [Blastocatellia bacterium]
MMKTLYLCYLGLREPLVQSQVLPYLLEIRQGGTMVRLVTFEPGGPRSWARDEASRWRERLAAQKIEWTPLSYHKSPSLLATLYDIAAGAGIAFRALRRGEAEILHARAHVPLVMAMLAKLLAGKGKVIFDIRGLVADEYVDAGIWKKSSIIYDGMKWVERFGIRRADRIVVLTDRFFRWIVENFSVDASKIEVIPCCADMARYAPAPGEGEAERFEILYAGSVTGLYLLDEMGRFFLALRSRFPGAFFRVLTTSPAREAAGRLIRQGLSEDHFAVQRADPCEIPGYLRRARVGLSFRMPAFSQIAASPTKIAEYLAAGLPVVSNAGIGDTDQILSQDRVGAVLDGFSPADFEKTLADLERLLQDRDLADRCRRAARRRFDLHDVGGERYRKLYRSF